MKKRDWLKELNPQQLQAVTYGDGPVLVVAGAGSGKTKTLACRVAWLISQGISPDRILLLTFTRRAAKEMLDRASQALNDQTTISQVWSGTFHAVANRLLRIYSQSSGLPADFTIIDQSDAEDMLDVIRQKVTDAQKRGRFPRKGTLLSIYSRKMNSGEDLDYILKKLYPWCVRWKEELKTIFKEYTALKQKRGTLDYDDLLLYWYYLLEDPRAAERISGRFDHILVDEYQDTNKLQSDILTGMRRSIKNVMAVGDDAQSIYSFRAATVRNMLDFPKIFPGTGIITLEQNYRSSPPILNTTNVLIAQAKERFSKNLFSTREGGERPKIITCKDELQEAEMVIERVLRHYEEGIPLRKQAVLFRAGSHSASLELALLKKEIPFHKYGGLKFLEAAHIKDFVSLIRILENPRDEMAWFRVLQLFDGVGPATASAIFDYFRASNFSFDSLQNAPVSKPVLMELLRMRKMFIDILKSDLDLSSQLDRIRVFYKPLLEDNYENSSPRQNDIEHLVELSRNSKSRTQFLTDLVLDPPVSTSDLAGPPLRDEDYLILSTIHSAKGCEWDAVYLIHAADGCLPSDMSTESEEDIAEELRLTYVAMTRARDHLYVLWPMKFYSHPQGFSDRHVYAQRCRFFNQDVVDTMDKVSIMPEAETDNKETLEIGSDIQGRLRKMWD